MKLKKCFSMILSLSMALSCVILPSQTSALADGEDYGTVTDNSDGSVTLNFGDNSITQSGRNGKEAIVTDGKYNVKRADYFEVDTDGKAVLTLPSVNLSGTDYTKVDITGAVLNSVSVDVKVGETTVASYDNVYTGNWNTYSTFTADLITKDASGNVTLNFTLNSGASSKYAGNYVYVKFYNGAAAPSETTAPSATAAPGNDSGVLPYQDESLSFEERAADLVSRMTLEEKVAQLGYTAPAIPRLGVSAYNYWKECLHGVARQGQATSFPTSLSLSNTWNRELVHSVADITSTEARAKNNRYNLSYYTPTINMARDPRWGRNDETYGEDPYLTGQLGGEFVKGMQGDDDKYIKIIATIKHFAANNNESYRRGGSSIMNEFNFRNYYLKVFRNVTEIEMPGSVMSSYNATSIYRNGELLYNYLPSAANTYLLTDILRRTWGFDGYVTTDCGAGEDLIGNTSYMNGILGSTTAGSAAYIAAALKAGMDVECNLGGGNVSTQVGADAVLEGYISEEELETNIYHLFLQRFRTGEFDTTSTYRDITSDSIETDENVAIAEEAAEESWVLLKNDDNILPISSGVTKVAVVGNMANTLALGDYAGTPTKTVKPIDGIRTALEAQGAEVSYLGEITDDEKLFNVKSVTLVMKNGTKKTIDLSTAESVSGMTVSNGAFLDVTPSATAVIKNVNFLNVVSIEAEMSTGSRIGGSLNIAYGQGGPTVAAVNTTATADNDAYTVCSGAYTGEDGGYNGTTDMYISASAAVQEFSVENYEKQLEAADVIIAYAGTIPKQDGFGDWDAAESKDRTTIDLPSHQAHVRAICDAYPTKTVVVMSTVGQINVEPFMNNCKAILWTSYNGQTQGTALGKVLTGEVNPSGRLTTTWYKNDDVKNMELSNTTNQTIGGISGKYTDYDIQAEGTNPGHTYQYYSNTPVYPFGYGLSYTSFEYSNMTIDNTSVDANGTVTFSVDVTNTGNAAGKEVVQLYVAHPQDGAGTTPKKQLKGFEKIELAAGATQTVEFTLDVADMELYSEALEKNEVRSGEYTAYIGKNADDTALSRTFTVSGTLDASLKTVKALPDGITVSSYISEDGSTMKSIYNINANVSAVMNDESVYDLENAQVSYTSSNEAVATVNEDGVVTSGKTEGVATITASVTIDGVTKTDSFPVVNALTISNDDLPYVISKVTSKNDSAVDVTLTYRGSVEPTEVTLKAEVLDENNEVKNTAAVNITGAGKYEIITGAEDGETVRYTVSDSEGVARSESLEEIYNTPVPSKIVAYYLENPNYDYTVLTGGEDKIQYTDTVNGLSGYGSWSNSASKADYTYVDVNDNEYNYSFTKAWAAGSGGTTNRCLYFTPEGPCKVTAVFYGSESARSMTIAQGSKKVTQEGIGAAVDLSLEVTDTSTPVYVYGGSNTKYLYAIIVEYYGMGGDDDINTTPTPNPGQEVTDTYKVAAGTYSAGEVIYDGDFKLAVTNNITAAENSTDGFDAGLTFRTQLGGDISAHVDDIVSHFADAGLNNTTECTSLIFTPKYDGTASIYLTGISGDRTLNVWDNTSNTNDPVSVSNSVFPATFKVKAGHEYILYGRKYSSTLLGMDLTYYTEPTETISPVETTAPIETTVPIETTTPIETTSPITTPAPNIDVTVSYDADNTILNLSSNSSGLETAAVIKASYENGALKNVNLYTAEFTDGSEAARQAAIPDFELSAGDKVFVWDSVKNMRPYADVFEYIPEGEEIDIQVLSWNDDNDIVLTQNSETGETKVWQILVGNQRVELPTDTFYEIDDDVQYTYGDKFTINALATYKDRLYAGCDDGIVIVFTNCVKCYRLKKVCDFDIKQMSIADGMMYVSDGENNSEEISMSDIGGDLIEPEEARVLIGSGALLIDVRDEEEFKKDTAENSINLPLNKISELKNICDADTTIIFCCTSGTKAGTAVKEAQKLGYMNTYNGGRYQNF